MSQGAGTRPLAGRGAKCNPLYPAVGTVGKLPADHGEGWTTAGCRVHMIGIGGCGMRGAAAVLLRGKAVVSGSDQNDSTALRRLASQGATIRIGQDAGNLPEACDLVVYSAAIKESNPELAEARRRNLRVVKYSQLLGLLMSERIGIGISGTHGKSTTTAMVSYVLREAGKDPSFVIGAGVAQLKGGSGVGDGPQFVVEACEFDRSFLNLRPQMAAILNVEEDHLDCYPDLTAIKQAFTAFAGLIPPDGLLVVNGQDQNVLDVVRGAKAHVQTFGLSGDVDWRGEILDAKNGCCRFRVIRGGKPLMEVALAIPGEHHVLNALAAIALCFASGVEPDTIAEILGRFEGAYRRLTLRGQVAGITVVDDYGHHPTEIQVTLKAARQYYNPRRMFVVFQPHQHSRTRFLLEDFAQSFGSADVVIVPEIYFVRDSICELEKIGSGDLVERINSNGGQARYEPDFARIAAQLCAEVQSGDLVVTMGAGNVWQIAERLLKCLAATRPDAQPLVLAGDTQEY